MNYGLAEVSRVFDILFSFILQMYNKDSEHDWLGEVVIASCGAGVITTFALARGQNPLVALGITAFAATAAILINRLF